MSPALTSGFLISEPPGKPTAVFLIRDVMLKTAAEPHQAFVRGLQGAQRLVLYEHKRVAWLKETESERTDTPPLS